jgi:hypothetical protein
MTRRFRLPAVRRNVAVNPGDRYWSSDSCMPQTHQVSAAAAKAPEHWEHFFQGLPVQLVSKVSNWKFREPFPIGFVGMSFRARP